MALRVGIIGFGEIGRYHARHLAGAGAHVVGAVTSRATPATITRYHSVADLLAEVDAVTIAVPNHLHASLCLDAVGAGLAVFVEKPMCILEGELATLEATLPTAVQPVHVGLRLRWNPALRDLRARLADVRRVRCTYRLGIDRLAAGKSWTRRQAESGGAFCTLGVHALDLARWLASANGRPIGQLRAGAAYRGPHADFPLMVHMEGRIHDGPTIEAAADLRGNTAFELIVEAETDHGTFKNASLTGIRPEDDAASDAEYAGMMRHFVEAARGGPAAPDEIRDVLECHRELLLARALAAGEG